MCVDLEEGWRLVVSEGVHVCRGGRRSRDLW